MGCVSPGKEYMKLRKEIANKLKNLKHPITKQPLDVEIYFSEEAYSGPYVHLAPGYNL